MKTTFEVQYAVFDTKNTLQNFRFCEFNREPRNEEGLIKCIKFKDRLVHTHIELLTASLSSLNPLE